MFDDGKYPNLLSMHSVCTLSLSLSFLSSSRCHLSCNTVPKALLQVAGSDSNTHVAHLVQKKSHRKIGKVLSCGTCVV